MSSSLNRILSPIAGGFDFASRAAAAIARRLRPVAKKSGYSSQVRFATVFDGSVSSLYQLKLWLPVFEQVGEPFDVILRNPDLVEPVRKLTKAKVHLLEKFESIPNNTNLKLIFYVNNSPYNSDAAKFPGITHVQLLHGDSEKTASFNPVTGMFTKIWVSGQAAVDRYERNGVLIHPSKFVLVGRPQLEGIKQSPAKAPKRKTVLIAPTWGGSADGEVYTSLALAPANARDLIRLGHRVVFRPHPFSHRDPADRAIIEQVWALLKADGKDHLYGPAAESQLTVTECINLCDVMISDLSGIVSDWLYSLKPYLLVSMDESAAKFTKRYPIAEGATVLTQADGLTEALLSDDAKLAAKRKQVRSYYIAGADKGKPSELFMKATRAALG
ncbi:MAG: hypothetical protein RL140_622 [Actinomycetota bacterium]|jgi:hypothetical protein